MVVSHDRYFIERVCDDVYALMGDGGIRHLPGGVDQYVALRAEAAVPAPTTPRPRGAPPSGAVLRAARKDVQRLERELDRLAGREAALHDRMAAHATDHERLRELTARLGELAAERERVETAWLEASELLEA